MTLTPEQKVQLAECYEQYGRLLNLVIEDKQFDYAKHALKNSQNFEHVMLLRGKAAGLTEFFIELQKKYSENKKIEEVSHT